MNERDRQYWQTMAERYFDAQTTDEEELLLRQFAATTDDPAFDELRAVLGYSAVARRQQPAPALPHASARRHVGRYAAAVTALLVIGLVAARYLRRDAQPGASGDLCLAYVHGQMVSDEAQVMALMRSTTSGVIGTDEDMAMEQLRDMFDTLN